MIKARKNNLIILGLSEENIKHLQKDHPIRFKLSELKIPDGMTNECEVLIFAGKTEQTMGLTLKKMIQPNINN